MYTNYILSSHIKGHYETGIQSTAKTIAEALASNIYEREREIVLMSKSALLLQADSRSGALRQAFEKMAETYRHYAWIAFTDMSGQVQTATGGLLEGQNVSHRPWFAQGKQGAYIGDAHEAVLLAKLLAVKASSEPLRLMDFTAPVYGANGKPLGVLAAHVHWSWVDQTITGLLPENTSEQSIEVIIFNRSGQVLYPYAKIDRLEAPPGILSRDGYATIEWENNVKYVTSSIEVNTRTATQPGWRVVVRQPIEKAQAPITKLHTFLWIVGAFIVIIVQLLAYRLAIDISHPIERLADMARRIAEGEQNVQVPKTRGVREIENLSTSLQQMTHTLLLRERELQETNLTLEQKVLARTDELLALNRKLEQLARQDALTGIANRLCANERIHEEFLRMRRTQSTYSVLLMDIDFFKKINDTHGHETGDRVIRHIAGTLKQSVRITDFVARFGGEEFLMILPDTKGASAVLLAEKLCAQIARDSVPNVGQITLSIGVAEASPDDVSEGDAIRAADKALYQAKSEGRNRVCSSIDAPYDNPS